MNEPARPPSWKQPVLEALRESDKRRLGELVLAAEHAIILRQQELKHSSDHHEERSEMQVAIAALLSGLILRPGLRCWLPAC
jgi:hypothetical protein